MRFAIAAWVVPLVVTFLFGTASWFDSHVAYPQPVGEPEPCFVTESGSTVCPEEEIPRPSPARRITDVVASEKVLAPIALLGGLISLVCAIRAVVLSRALRATDSRARLAFRLGVAALVAWVAIPLLVGAAVLFVVASFPIRG